MIGRSIIPIHIDTDNALGIPKKWLEIFFGGDVDDAFALSFLLKSHLQIQQITSVGGNTSAAKAHQNNQELTCLISPKLPGICSEGLNPLQKIDSKINFTPRSTFLSLGPLTNLASLLKSSYQPHHIWMTLGRIETYGKWPPFWPIEFNATQDIPALLIVMKSDFPKTIVPLDVAFKLKLKKELLSRLQKSELGFYLYKNSLRWARRSLILKGRSSFPVWDLLSAMALAYPEACVFRSGLAYVYKNGLVRCLPDGSKNLNIPINFVIKKPIQIVTSFDENKIWDHFFSTLDQKT